MLIGRHCPHPRAGVSTTKEMLTFWRQSDQTTSYRRSTLETGWKPQTHTAPPVNLSAALWQTRRSDNISSDKRVLDVYPNSKALGFYNALVGIIPDYDSALSILAGGSELTLNPFSLQQLASNIVTNRSPVTEKAGSIQAAEALAEICVYTMINSTLKLELDDGSGLLLTRLDTSGYDALSNITSYRLQAVASEVSSNTSSSTGGLFVNVRFCPSDKISKDGKSGNSTAEAS
ncbi:putative Beta-lactamase/transpeptidase-like protein [Seiridium cardinale]|uniref:Beta-lactamase/transpeptidase-like protein n=1 Tax=Seiridium cardinale TaxID=138064 RepID=A0ABR2XQT7_9PEZI